MTEQDRNIRIGHRRLLLIIGIVAGIPVSLVLFVLALTLVNSVPSGLSRIIEFSLLPFIIVSLISYLTYRVYRGYEAARFTWSLIGAIVGFFTLIIGGSLVEFELLIRSWEWQDELIYPIIGGTLLFLIFKINTDKKILAYFESRNKDHTDDLIDQIGQEHE